jgi:arsenate reductase (thioredoxin)
MNSNKKGGKNMSRQKPLLYFLCTGNSCRSQMADGWGKHFGEGNVEVFSAGIETHGLNPHAVAAMKDADIDISNYTSDLIDPAILNRADYVITLCGDANDKCPITPPHVKRLHWGFEDPAKATGTEEEIAAKFNEVRDAIRDRVQGFLKELNERS